MRNIDTLIRLHRAKVDEARRAVNALRDERDRLSAQIKRLMQELESEKSAAQVSVEASVSFAGYIQQVRTRREIIAQSMEALDVRIEAASDVVAEAFRELKKFELTAERRREAEQAEQEHREQIQMDEVALDMHRRSN